MLNLPFLLPFTPNFFTSLLAKCLEAPCNLTLLIFERDRDDLLWLTKRHKSPLLPSLHIPSCKVPGSSLQPHFAFHPCEGWDALVFSLGCGWMPAAQQVGPQAGYIVRTTDTSHPLLPSFHTPSCKVSGSSMQPHFAHHHCVGTGMSFLFCFLIASKVLALGP